MMMEATLRLTAEQAVIDKVTTECLICRDSYVNSDDPPKRKPRVLQCGHN